MKRRSFFGVIAAALLPKTERPVAATQRPYVNLDELNQYTKMLIDEVRHNQQRVSGNETPAGRQN